MGMGSRGDVIHFYPFLLLLFLALTYNTCPSFSSSSSSSKNQTHLCLPSQRDALLRFKNAYNITLWDEHVDCCRWAGINCDSITGDVIGVDANDFNIMGAISYITYLSPLYNLQKLYLSNSHLHGVVPLELSHFSKLTALYLCCNPELTMESHSLELLLQNLTQLKGLGLEVKIFGDPFNALVNISNALTNLYLDRCDLHGVLPESIFHLPNLQVLSVRENIGLMVSFPTLNWSSPLELLDLSSTNFSGKLPNSVGNLKNLRSLQLSSIHISNPLPSSFENLTRLSVLSLSSFARRDAFPSSLICRLSSLGALILPDNKFSGMIPQCLGNMTNLEHLVLSYNQLTGLSLSPPVLAAWKLKVLDVNSNIISDTATNLLQFFPDLISVNLGTNSFHGEIPPFICRNTIQIDLSNNMLTGTIPPCLIQNHGTRIINLRMNKLEGTIPNTMSPNCTIGTLDLSENQLKGPLPRSMVNCEQLEVLNLGGNSIEDIFPNWLETLPELKVLVLNFNKLHGEVKPLLNHHPFPKLSIFDISNNNFTGPLPTAYITRFDAMKDTNVSNVGSIYLSVGAYVATYSSTTITMKGSTHTSLQILSALKLLDFSNNNFEGEIPNIIGDLIALKGLNLSHNNLIGNIPLSIQNMTSLEWLDLSSNKLTGQIPDGLTRLTQLGSLNLSHNELKGMIPTGKQFDTFDKDSFVGNAGLCGTQIAVACGKPDAPKQPTVPHIQDYGFNVFDWKIILIGYGCGLVIGLSIGYVIFELQRPEWFVSLVEEKLLNKILRQSRRANRLRRT